MELTYRREGDYLLPNLKAPEAPKIGKYGMLRREYLRKNRDPIYTGMFLNGTLNSHLEETDRKANEMLESLTTQMAKSEGVTESLKSNNQMLWVQMMNNIQSRAEEIVLTELIYS
ncbi:MAG: TnpV protein [Synergistaceae bacterium]|nr:TnpV protein [Synergistaceae bacterium]